MPRSMTAFLLVINAGSSSIKFSLFENEHPQASALKLFQHGMVANTHGQQRFSVWDKHGSALTDSLLGALAEQHFSHDAALRRIIDWLSEQAQGEIRAIGHRVVHGGDRYNQPVAIDPHVLDDLRALIPLAPLHQPHSLSAIEFLAQLLPGIPQVACFDTAFHQTQPVVARRFGIPRALHDAGTKRYGFHGLSYEYIARVLPQYLGDAADARVIVAHLGNGASMCALQHRQSVATTMGFTPLDGLLMGTRCGTIDPGVLLYLMKVQGYDAARIEHLLYHESGLLGVSAISGDMATLLRSNAAQAAEAIDLFVYRAVREIGSLASALGGLDALVFTGGIGENAAAIRERICHGSAWLGVQLDTPGNQASARCITVPDSRISAWVIPAREDEIIARHTLVTLGTV